MEFLNEEQRVTLAELLDQDSLHRLCMAFSRLYETGLAILDPSGHIVVDSPAELGFCRRVRALPQGIEVCSGFDEMARVSRPRDEDQLAPGVQHCLCGLRYESISLEHQGELLGRVIYGPYRPAGAKAPSATLGSYFREHNVDEERLRDAFQAANAEWDKIEPRSPERVREQLARIQEIFSVVVQAGYARHLTSQIHINAIQDAYEELQEKNRRLADSLERLKELDKIRSSFLATFSHELRTPLTSIIGYSEMLIEGVTGELEGPQKQYIQTIMDKGGQLLRMINEILDISKINHSTVQLEIQDVQLAITMDQVVNEMMPQARRKNISLSFDVPGDLPLLRADRAKIRQVFLNLVSNGIKFTREGGAVRIKAETGEPLSAGEPPTVRILVEDQGIGIPPECRELVFEAFYQVDSSSTRQFDGTGLGLAIVKQFVEAHGGRVWVLDSSNTGTTFAVVLPTKARSSEP